MKVTNLDILGAVLITVVILGYGVMFVVTGALFDFSAFLEDLVKSR